MVRNTVAQKIAASWHGGQWSALYQFASSGIYLVENHLRYLQEIETELHPEYNLIPGTLTKAQEKELNKIRTYFIRMGEKQGIETTWRVHSLYGYNIPYAGEQTPKEVLDKIIAISYPI